MKIIKIEETQNEKELALFKAVQDYKKLKEEIALFEKQEKILKDKLKEYDFDKVEFITNQGNISFSINQFETTRKTFNHKNFFEEIEKLYDTKTAEDLKTIGIKHTKKTSSKAIRIDIKEIK